MTETLHKQEMITVPDWNAEKPQPDYKAKAEHLLTEVDYIDDPTEVRREIDDFLRGVRGDVLAGRVEGSRGVYTPDEYNTQMISFLDAVNKPEKNAALGDKIYNFIPGAFGLREAFKSLSANERTVSVLLDVVHSHVAEFEQYKQEQKNIGTSALEAADIPAPQSPEERLATLKAQFGEDDLLLLRQYADAHESMVDARKSEEGENAQYWEQQLGQAYREMSPEARSAAFAYTNLYHRIES